MTGVRRAVRALELLAVVGLLAAIGLVLSGRVRVEPVLTGSMAPRYPTGTLVAVTHGGSGRVLIGSMVGLPPEHWSALGVLSNCCWTVLTERSDRWAITEHNAGTLPEPVLSDD